MRHLLYGIMLLILGAIGFLCMLFYVGEELPKGKTSSPGYIIPTIALMFMFYAGWSEIIG